jgi:hypothetical protein
LEYSRFSNNKSNAWLYSVSGGVTSGSNPLFPAHEDNSSTTAIIAVVKIFFDFFNRFISKTAPAQTDILYSFFLLTPATVY